MGAGKILCIIGGIVTLLATFLFSFASIAPAHFYYIAFLMNFSAYFDVLTVVQIIFVILFLIIMVSGVFILIGMKVRALAIIGGILAIFMGVYWLLTIYVDWWLEIESLVLLFADLAIVEGFIPLAVPLDPATGMALGTILFLAGGVLGLIGGIMGPDSF
jgi:hypothetical protein